MGRSRAEERTDGWRDDDAGPVNESPTRPRTLPGVGTPLRTGGAQLIATRIKGKERGGKGK